MPRVNLTTQRIADATCPAGLAELILHDVAVPGLAVRVYSSGRKVYVVQYRAGYGRSAPQRRLALGRVGSITLADARRAAQKRLGEVALGADPSAERRRRRERLEPALAAYEKDLARRHVVKRAEVMSLLRREMLLPFGNVAIDSLTRKDFVSRIAAVEASGRPGAAQELRKSTAVFLGWAVEVGLITASPLAGWRRKRRTRAERLERPGRALAELEIGPWWHAVEPPPSWFNGKPVPRYSPFSEYLKILLLLGQRRTETALMRWNDLALEAGVWTIPAGATKSGREHRVPLPRLAVEILQRAPGFEGGLGYVFAGRQDRPMTGWSKRLPPVYARTAAADIAPWTPHDLRRTMRTGLGRLGIDQVVAELLMNHAISDDLAAIYDRGDYWQQRVAAAERWADHVSGRVDSFLRAIGQRSR